MARRFPSLTFTTLLAASLAGASALHAEEPAASPAQSSAPSASISPPPAAQHPSPAPARKKLDQLEQGRRFFDQLSPDQERRVRENFERWKKMPPEERDAMRGREQFRREKIAQEIDESIRKSGLHLDADHREVYALRYTQERRKIEEQLRREMEAKRRPMMRDMLERLKGEFSHTTAAAPSPSPAASPLPSPMP